jgi:UPF0755 protein
MLIKKENLLKLLKLISIRFLTGTCFLVLFLVSYWQWLAYQQFLHTPMNISSEEQTLTVKPGDSINLLARKWQKQGLISNQYYLRIFCYLNPEYKNIKLGEYQLIKHQPLVSLLKKISQGKVIQYSFTIIEGMNSYEVLKTLTKHSLLNNDINTDDLDVDKTLSIKNTNTEKSTKFEQRIEGWLFPDTYYYSRDEKASKLLARAANKMQKVLSEEWENRALDLPYDNAYQALIMASIIEKETGISGERNKIAGVFVRRLKKRMKLGTDPTVIYGIGPDFNGDITFKDLRTKTPYNTRIIKGLPPTPIAMPSRASIRAALHPEDGDSLYFVADGSGGHYFSKTLEEHNKAVKRYLKLIRQKSG